MKRWIIEFLFPWIRLNRIQAELNAKDREEGTKMYIEYWTKTWPEQQLALAKQPLLIKRFMK